MPARSICVAMLVLVGLTGCSKSEPTACTSPRKGWISPQQTGPEAAFNRLTLTHDGRTLWNDSPVNRQEIAALLASVYAERPAGVVVFDPEMGVRCADIDALRDMVDAALHCQTSQDGLCSEGAWSRAPVPRPPGPNLKQ